MTDRLVRAYGRNLVRQTVLGLVVAVVVALALGCLCVAIALIPESLVGRDGRAYLFIGALIGFVLLAIGGVAAYVLLVVNRRAYAQLDEAFTPFGLAGSRYMLTGRQYRGTYRGRQVNVYYYVSGGRYLRSLNLQIYVSGTVGTRLGIGTRNVLTNLGGAITQSPELATNDPAYEGLAVYPADERWASRLLADLQARGAIERLAGQNEPGMRGLIFNPAAVQLHLRHFDVALITPNVAGQWLKDLVALVEIAEDLPPPSQVVEATNLERAGQSDRSQFRWIALGIVGVVVLCPTAVAICAVVTLFASGAMQ